ncbi:hypothetical protein [Streptomyces wuyuanensis]|uniref:hypothetical protein n=1 Tax=Streptomyces wuyuanensis TaxID=1196353 RepID=UPI0036757097
MIALSVDSTSSSYAAGQSLAALLVTGAVMALIWRVTRSWRQAGTAHPPTSQVATAAARAKRRRIVLGVLALVAAAGCFKAVSVHNPEPRVAEAGADDSVGESAVPKRTVAPPNRLRHHRLMTREETAGVDAALAQRGPRRQSDAKRWYYGSEATGVSALLSVHTVEDDPELAAEKRRDSFAQEFRNFFAGARARDTAFFDAGPLRGRLGCGHLDTPAGEAAVCAWSDAYTSGHVLLTDTRDLDEAAQITREFRAATDRRAE